MKATGWMMTAAAAAALGAAAGIAAKEAGLISSRQIKSKAKRAARSLGDMM